MDTDDLVRVKGQTGTYRVKALGVNEVTIFGGPRRQWRTVKAAELRPATKREAKDFLRAEGALLEAARGIKPARSIKAMRKA